MASLCNIQRSLFITFLFPSDSNTLQSAGAWMENEEKMKKPKTYTSNVSFLHRENSRLNCFVRPIHLNRKNDFFRCPLPFVPMVGPLRTASASPSTMRTSVSRKTLEWNSDGMANYHDCLFSSESARCNGWLWCAGICRWLRGRLGRCDDQTIFFCFITLLRESLGVWWKFKLKVNMAVTSSIFVSA